MTVTNRRAVITGLALAISLLLIFPYIHPTMSAQTAVTFTSTDQFSIPQKNGLINFAVNGSFSSATMENDTWFFRDLRLRNAQTMGNLTVSVENSNMTIYSYRGSTFIGAGGTLRCLIQGQGKQTINLGLNTTQPTHPSEWYITTPGPNNRTVFLAENEGWTLMPDNSVVITGITGNLSLTHYSGFSVPDNSNLPFYEQHSIIIITAALVVVTAAISVAVKFRGRR